MVQNSLGAQWLATYPHSTLAGQMDYYIEPAEQTDEVKAQLATITPSVLNPEGLTLIDPACGSGHILVEAYELFKAIYLERGYRQRDVAQLILEKNIFGLDIDERAAQLTGFALMMKGRADDRRLFERGVKLNVVALQDRTGFDAERLAQGVKLAGYGLKQGDLTELKQLFEHATTFGSLIQVPDELAEKLPALKQLSEATSQDLFVSEALKHLGPLVQQAEFLTAQYDTVVANPPYMGSKYQTPILKQYLKERYKGYDKDFFSAFIVRELLFSKVTGEIGVVAPYVWMFLSSYEDLRKTLIQETTLSSLIQLEYNAFEPACIPVGTFTLKRRHANGFIGSFIKLSEFKGHENQAPRTLEAIRNPECGWFFSSKPDEFNKVPGSPVAYWLSDALRAAFSFPSLETIADIRQGMATTDNQRFLRLWHEVETNRVQFEIEPKVKEGIGQAHWFPYNKGGAFRKWYGNNQFIVDYEDNGEVLINLVREKYPRISDPEFVIKNRKYYFRQCASWSDITSGALSARYIPVGFAFDTVGPSAFSSKDDLGEIYFFVALLNSKVSAQIIPALNPTLHFNLENAKSLPAVASLATNPQLHMLSNRLVEVSTVDWDAYERSWDFQSLPLLTASSEPTQTLESSYTTWISQNCDTIAEMKRLEEENNRLFIDAYGLADELTPDIHIEQITLTVNPAYRYGGKLTEEEQWTRFRQDTMKELISYAIGCMMGRYSLDQKGLVYAHAGNEGFDHNKYKTFPADDDGIVPITDYEWFDDDVACRFFRFIETAWDKDTLGDNLEFIADAIGRKTNESSRDSIRKYFVSGFYKDHLTTYKKRHIYWLFTSGKEKAFQALVYLHRYNEGTLSRMRTEYVLPLQSKMATRMEHLEKDKEHASSTSAANKIQKEIGRLRKQKEELLKFDENLRHYANMKITLDLDDGVKVNYGKFGDLLAEVKAVTGKKQK